MSAGQVIASARKALVAVATIAAAAVAAGLLHGTAQNIAQLIIAVTGAIGVYAVPNAKPAPKP